MIIMKIDAIPALFVGMLLGGIFAVIFQPDLIIENGKKNTLTLSGENIEDYHITWLDESGNELYKYETAYNLNGGTVILQLTKDSTTINKTITLPYAMENEVDAFDITDEGTRLEDLGLSIALTRSSYAESAYRTTIDAMTAETSINTENATINDLLGTSGMFGMMNTIWLIVCAMAFGGVMEKLGMLNTITEVIVAKAKSTGSLIATTALTCVGFNITASDQYLSIVVPGKMFAKEYEKRGLAPQNLSRTLEDAGTVTSVLVPWNTCGAVQSNVLGIATGEYFFYCIFNIISPLMTITFGFLGIKIAKLTKS
ncbi:MAG: hypothetical protein H6600_08660 [Flavobacteriales bacterium]|nr:hypothetical protein [Flavobacteriales bacterium]